MVSKGYPVVYMIEETNAFHHFGRHTSREITLYLVSMEFSSLNSLEIKRWDVYRKWLAFHRPDVPHSI